MANVQYRGTGRRKSSVARVILTPGTGNIVINDKPAKEYLPSENTFDNSIKNIYIIFYKQIYLYIKIISIISNNQKKKHSNFS